MSPHCNCKAWVTDSAQGVAGVKTSLANIATLLALPLGGAAADGIGRQAVLVAYGCVCVVAMTFYLLDALGFLAQANVLLYAGGACAAMATAPLGAVFSAQIADQLGHDGPNKSRAFVLLSAVSTVGSAAATAVAYGVLRLDLTEYTSTWTTFAVLAALIVGLTKCAVPETLPPEVRDPGRTHSLSVVTAV
jgi:MFS family permease